VLVGAYVTPEGIIEGEPGSVLRLRGRSAPDVMIFADVRVKHAHPVVATTIDEEALDAVERGGADCLIVTGPRTGAPPSGDDLRAVRERLAREAIGSPVLVGSGVTPSNAREFLGLSDGLIVGSYVRRDGRAGHPVDPERARELASIKQTAEG
jgi:hypothetical protein